MTSKAIPKVCREIRRVPAMVRAAAEKVDARSMRYRSLSAVDVLICSAAWMRAGSIRGCTASTTDEPGSVHLTRSRLIDSTERPNIAANSPRSNVSPLSHPVSCACAVGIRWAPHELDSVKDGQASPSPPIARAGSGDTAAVVSTTATYVTRARRIPPRYRSCGNAAQPLGSVDDVG